jgi:hypothetical protein
MEYHPEVEEKDENPDGEDLDDLTNGGISVTPKMAGIAPTETR